MGLSVSRIHGFKSIVAVLALTACAGTLQATNLTATPGAAGLSCNTATGPGASTSIVIKPLTALVGVNTLAVTVGALTGGVVVTAPQVTTLSTANQAAGITYTVSLAAGCVGVTNNGTPSINFLGGGLAGVTVTTTTTLVSTTSALVASPSPIVITCAKSGNVYTPAAPKTVSITSAATGGTPFTVDTVTNPAPAWATVTPTTGGTATSSAVTFTVTAAAGCGAFALGSSTTGAISLLNAPAPAKSVPVTIQIVGPSPLTATPSAATISYIKGSGNPGHADINFTASGAPFFALDTSTLPIWLTVDSTSGSAPKSLRFTSTSATDNLAPGTYVASVTVKVSGFGDASVQITLLVNNKAPRMTVAGSTTLAIPWVLGTPLPTPTITAISSDTPIAYTAVSGGTLAPIISSAQAKGLAYSFGTPINITFNPLIFASATPGSVLTGTVTLTWGTPASTIVVTLNVTVQSAGATLTSLTPASLPTANAGATFSVVVSGTGFVQSTDPAQKTKVGIVVGGVVVPDTNIAVTVINPSNIMLTFTVPATADANLPFALGGTVPLGLCNPAGGTCSGPTGTATLSIGSSPIIQAVTSASAFLQVTAPTLQTMAPYDMVSVFGTNFCSSNSTGCSSSQVLSATADPTTLRYPTTLSPDSGVHNVSVIFQNHSNATLIATAPLLFAANSQINLLVPAALAGSVGTMVDLVVNYGTNHSAPYPVSITATNPGIFTVGADGQGDGAALATGTYALINSTNPGGMRSTATDSDTVQLYVTGLGVPTSTGDNSTAGTGGGAVVPTDCITPASYWASLNTATNNAFTNMDGTVVQSLLLNTNRLVPCFVSNPIVTVGGLPAVVTYAGFVADSVAGLYQINVKLPGSTAGSFTTASGATITSVLAPVQLPVLVTANSVASQTGVNLWVAPRLLVTPPTTLSGTVGVAWSSSNNAFLATEGTGSIKYTLTSGLLPSGLSLGAGTGAITGTPGANTAGSYVITVTATDSANAPVTGTSTVTISILGGLVVTSSGASPHNSVFGTAVPSVSTISALGGAFPYTYAITAPVSLPTGMSISSGVVGILGTTPAGTYHVTVTATDAATPAVTGTASFDVAVALHVTDTTVASPVATNAGAITTVSATGATGAVTYTLDATTAALGWVTINANTGAIAVTGSSVAGTYPVVVTATDGTTAPGAATAGTGTISFNLIIQ